MSTLIVGSFEAKKGIEYNGFVPFGNAFRTTEKVKMSINRSPMASIPISEDIFALSYFTYSFEQDTVILLTRVVQSDLSIIWNNSCPQDVTLLDAIESATICEVIAYEETTTGTIEALAYIENTNNQDKEVIFRVYNGVILLHSETFILTKAIAEAKIVSFAITTLIAQNDTISFTLEGNSNGLTVKGTINPSQIQTKRIT